MWGSEDKPEDSFVEGFEQLPRGAAMGGGLVEGLRLGHRFGFKV